MRSSVLVASLFAISAVAAVAQVACGGDDNAANKNTTPTPEVQDSGGFTFADAESGTTISITGAGSVFGSDPISEAGPPPVACVSDGTTTTGNCHASYHDTLYATAANGYVFGHWDPGGSTKQTYFVGPATPASITAVFVVDVIAQPDAGPPPPPVDSGHPDANDAASPDAADGAHE